MDEAILDGLRVVEAAAFVAAPLGGMTLAQMGADVIRIDAIGGGLDYRRWPVTADNTSLFWCGLNKSKRSVALDLSTEEGRELAMGIATAPGDDAGIFLTNFPARGWLDHDKLKARRADLIQLTLQGDREGGAAVDYTVNPKVGIPSITGDTLSEQPVNHVLPAWDLITGQMVAVGLLAAERFRRRTGKGQHIKLALEDVALAVMGHLGFLAEAQLGHPRQRHGNELFGAFGRDFMCRNGRRVMVVCLTSKQWRSLCKALGLAEAMEQLASQLGLDLSREGDRFQARREIAQLVGQRIGQLDFIELEHTFNGQGVCWSPYQTIAELVAADSGTLSGNPMFNSVDQSNVGRIVAAGIPLDFSATARRPAEPAPRLGSHTEEVLAELLGVDGPQYGKLHDRGVVA